MMYFISVLSALPPLTLKQKKKDLVGFGQKGQGPTISHGKKINQQNPVMVTHQVCFLIFGIFLSKFKFWQLQLTETIHKGNIIATV